MKLLYAEDEKALSDAVSEILDFYKHTADAVYKGEDALYYLENEKYDGAILDLGADDYLVKPFNTGGLIAIIKNLKQ